MNGGKGECHLFNYLKKGERNIDREMGEGRKREIVGDRKIAKHMSQLLGNLRIFLPI